VSRQASVVSKNNMTMLSQNDNFVRDRNSSNAGLSFVGQGLGGNTGLDSFLKYQNHNTSKVSSDVVCIQSRSNSIFNAGFKHIVSTRRDSISPYSQRRDT